MSKKYNHAIIMARGGSKGIKRKNLKKINGKPLIYWTVKYCLAQKFISNTWVSSDDDEILNAAESYGAKIIKIILLGMARWSVSVPQIMSSHYN